MTTELFKEAIIEARKLKEVAELDARNKVIEAVTPIIKKMIAKESANTQTFLFGEDEVPVDAGVDLDPTTMEMPKTDSATTSGMPPVGGDVPNAAPISPMGDLAGMPMPDEEGKITVDFGQLWNMGAGSQGGMEDGTAQEKMVSPDSLGAGSLPPGGIEPGIAGTGAMGGLPPGPSDPMGAAVAPVNPAVAAVGPEANPGQTDLTGQGAGQAGGVGLGGQTVQGTPTPEEIGQEPEPLIAGEGKIVTFQNEVRTLAERIDILYFRGSVPTLVKESVKSRLFSLCEQLDQFVNEGVVSNKKARIAENKLEFLFMKLNEAEEKNSYKMDKGAHMTSLKEFAAKLFEEDALGPATADKATAHAEKVSGIQPGVDLFKENEEAAMKEELLDENAPASSAFGDGKAEGNAENKTPEVHDADALVKKPGAGIVESAPASSAFGDGQKATGAENTTKDVHVANALVDEKGANSILEFDEKELKEAVTKLRKENLARRLKAVKEAAEAGALKGTVSDKDGLSVPKPKEGDQGSAKAVGGKNPALENLKECGMDEVTALDGASSDMPGAGVGGGEVELTFSIDVDDLEALLNGSSDAFVAEPTSEVPGVQAGEDPMDSIEVVDDHDAAGGSDGDGLLLDKEEEEPKTESAPAASVSKPAPVKENKAKTVTGKQLVESLSKQLNEQKLLTAKSLFASKFLVREDISKKQKQKIVGYFDKATTIAEAQATYLKIKKILAEGASDSTKMTGSASKPTSAGSANLNENAGQTNSDSIERSRWMLLAGIPSKN